MYKICFPIDGVTKCFDVPELIAIDLNPPDPNFLDLELAIAVERLVEKVKPVIGETEFTRTLTEASTVFIQKVQKGLPKGMELTRVSEQSIAPRSSKTDTQTKAA
ncbi:MAG: hypothetical protein DMG97_17690 [Acidobacteria bacterium]|nr:MAG: hypothetical protein DMG97_17690 [Acidobacteriota bacterium]PYV76432.1 MAG: hypothetical protein DMG96_13975 [Acidobacteriota bacterium]